MWQLIIVLLFLIGFTSIALFIQSIKNNSTNKNKEGLNSMLKPIKEYCTARKQELKEQIEYFFKDSPPQLAIIQVGAVEASNRYIRNKIKDCKEVGINAHHYAYGEEITEEEFLLEIKDLAEHYDGVIVQLPLPGHISTEKVAAAIPLKNDVDGFGLGSPYTPATPLGIMLYLEYCGWNPEGKHVVIIGRSDIVGKPLARLMTDANATVTLCHSKTKNLWTHIQEADLVVSAVGKPNFLNCYSIHVPVIDVGINFNDEGKMCGDCFNTEGREVTPVPGGVGLLTRLALLENTFKARMLRDG